jgi:hypothetical protein
VIAIARTILSIAVTVAAASAQGQARPQITKEQLKADYAGVCRNPGAPIPKSIPEEKKAALVSWCACVQAAIDDIPDDRLEQALTETFEEFKKSKADPHGFVPVAQYSIVRIANACVKK